MTAPDEISPFSSNISEMVGQLVGNISVIVVQLVGNISVIVGQLVGNISEILVSGDLYINREAISLI